MIKITSEGDFERTFKFLKFIDEFRIDKVLNKYGSKGVDVLSRATPTRTGLTSNSWAYRTERTKNRLSIIWYNTNVNRGVNIAVILQYGHGTRNGGYVRGIDYINPAMRGIFESMVDEVWSEVTKA